MNTNRHKIKIDSQRKNKAEHIQIQTKRKINKKKQMQTKANMEKQTKTNKNKDKQRKQNTNK